MLRRARSLEWVNGGREGGERGRVRGRVRGREGGRDTYILHYIDTPIILGYLPVCATGGPNDLLACSSTDTVQRDYFAVENL